MPSSDKQLTGYAQDLQREGLYPLKPPLPWRERKVDPDSLPTPFLVLPNYDGDPGTPALRPLDPLHAVRSAAITISDTITIQDSSEHLVNAPKAGNSYFLHCHVQNRGAAGCYAGIVEFYATTSAELNNPESERPTPLGYEGCIIPPGGETVVVCRRKWNVTSRNGAVLVRVYDPLLDNPHQHPPYPYDSKGDRHVARWDIIPNFSGTYEGTESAAQSQGESTPIRIKITQAANNTAEISIYKPINGSMPATPQQKGTASITGSSFTFKFTELKPVSLGSPGLPIAYNDWTFKIANYPKVLTFEHNRRNVNIIPFSSTHTYGDLSRV